MRRDQQQRTTTGPGPSLEHDPGAFALWEWFETIPLSNTWRQCSKQNQERLLRFWL